MTVTRSDPLRLMAVLAHPDDESLGVGGTLAKYAAEGIATYVVTATRGERGRYFNNEVRPDDAELGRIREAELRAAAQELGVQGVEFLDYVDGELDQAEAGEVTRRIVDRIRRLRPQVVITFDPFGAYGHSDHVAICQLTTAAVVAAADPSYASDAPPHQVSKLYYFVTTERQWSAYQVAFKRLTSTVDGTERGTVSWPEWAVSAEIDTRREWPAVWRAVRRHESQVAQYQRLNELSPEQHEILWGSGTYYRVFSTVNGGRSKETDLFAGVR